MKHGRRKALLRPANARSARRTSKNCCVARYRRSVRQTAARPAAEKEQNSPAGSTAAAAQRIGKLFYVFGANCGEISSCLTQAQNASPHVLYPASRLMTTRAWKRAF